MTPAVILICLGVVLTLSGVVGVVIYPQPLDLKRAWQRWISVGLGLVLLLIGILLAVKPEASSQTVTPTTSPREGPTTPARSSGKITSPQPGPVSKDVQVAGTASNIGDSDKVWLVVEVGSFYPQEGPIPVLADSRWSGFARFGQDDDVGKMFTLHLVTTGPTGTQVFNEYLRRGQNTGQFPGLLRGALPSDIRYLDSITVIRR